MNSLKNSKNGDTTTNTIMWLGVVITILIGVSWYITKLKPEQLAQETLQFDLTEMKKIVSRACTSISFSNDYNPRTEAGFVSVNGNVICINSSEFFDCTVLSCNTSNNNLINLADITFVRIEKYDNLTIKEG